MSGKLKRSNGASKNACAIVVPAKSLYRLDAAFTGYRLNNARQKFLVPAGQSNQVIPVA